MKSIFRPPLKDYLNPPELRIIDSGYVDLDTRWNSKNSISPFSCFYIVESGSGVLIHKGKKVIMEKANAYLIPSGTIFDFSCPQKLKKLFFHFNMLGGDGLDVLRNVQEILYCKIHEDELSKIISLYKESSFSSSLELRHIILNILSRIMKSTSIEPVVSHEYSPFVKNVMAHIQENLSLNLSLSETSKNFFVAEVTLRKRFKAETGLTPRQYIEDLIFFKAELLLTTTNHTIKEISSALGFHDQFYFSRRFASRYSMPPQIYRLRVKS
ncbi:MAG: helix-turn-helix transcriptional regulator [Clostridia bacterium]|nr:helix-turn-helix transcriptional regulator [Clostridia bacterium]